jgi:hypothetical protein
MIYFLRHIETDAIKIGWSIGVPTRVAALQAAQPGALAIVRLLDAPRWAEAWLHAKFAPYRRHGEWFTFQPEMLTVEPPPAKPLRGQISRRSELLQIRAGSRNKELCRSAAKACGMSMSKWIMDRACRAARQELGNQGDD